MYYELRQTNIEVIQKYASAMLFAAIVILSCAYIYLINASVLDAVAREQNDKEIVSLSSAVGELENSYMNLRASLSIDVAKEMGFKDDFSKVHFSNENTNVAGSLTLLHDEI